MIFWHATVGRASLSDYAAAGLRLWLRAPGGEMTRAGLTTTSPADQPEAGASSRGGAAARWATFVIFCSVVGVGAVGAAVVVGAIVAQMASPHGLASVSARIATILAVVGVAGFFADRVVGTFLIRWRALLSRRRS